MEMLVPEAVRDDGEGCPGIDDRVERPGVGWDPQETGQLAEEYPVQSGHGRIEGEDAIGRVQQAAQRGSCREIPGETRVIGKDAFQDRCSTSGFHGDDDRGGRCDEALVEHRRGGVNPLIEHRRCGVNPLVIFVRNGL